MTPSTELQEAVDATQWIDTHEHLIEERHRLNPGPYKFKDPVVGKEAVIPTDWSALMVDYSLCDLISAGMPLANVDRFLGEDLGPVEKWDLCAPYLEASRRTGYLRAMDITTERLFDLRLGRETCADITERMRAIRKPGYFRDVILKGAGVSWCQVHTLDHDPFCVTEYPDLLAQDLSLCPLVCGRHATAEHESGIEVETLDDYIRVVEYCFDQYGDSAIAVKCLWAYLRPLQIAELGEPPRASFEHLRSGRASVEQQREVEDYLFDVCVELATARGLPVKLHLGTLDGNRRPPFAHVRDHSNAAAALAQRYPETSFVFMHMAWPHQEELLAVAKHYPNAHIDLCWSWILAPVATREFVRRFLSSAPATKLLCFGGDIRLPRT